MACSQIYQTRTIEPHPNRSSTDVAGLRCVTCSEMSLTMARSKREINTSKGEIAIEMKEKKNQQLFNDVKAIIKIAFARIDL